MSERNEERERFFGTHQGTTTMPSRQYGRTANSLLTHLATTLSSSSNRDRERESLRERVERAAAPQPTRSAPNIRPQFRTKIVCNLNCTHCHVGVCRRGMKAILLADTNVELFSTDLPPFGVQLVNDDYMTRNCRCRIKDAACLGCGNVVGYHVTQPCEACLEACNNGHFWMFHMGEVFSEDRMDNTGKKSLVWANLPQADKDISCKVRNLETLCR